MNKRILKIMIVMLLVSAITACQSNDSNSGDQDKVEPNNQVASESSSKEQDSSIEPDGESELSKEIEVQASQNTFDSEGLIGTWISKVEDNGYDSIYTIYIEQDGSFMTNDYILFDYKGISYAEWLSGTWTVEEGKIKFDAEKTIRPSDLENNVGQMTVTGSEGFKESISLDIKDYNGDSFKVGNKTYTKNVYEESEPLKDGDHGFSGYWERTNVYRSSGGSINILEIDNGYLFFSADVMEGANMGMITGMAKVISNDEALYIHDYTASENDSEFVYIKFKIEDGLLEVECNDNWNLEFGHNVVIDGEYTQDEPVYVNQDIVLDIFRTEERVLKIKNFLGEERWNFLKSVMDYGYDYPTENLTYSGFISGAGQGANFLMTDDDQIYYLSYGEDSRYVFYTNDSDYKNRIPDFLMDYISTFDDVKFMYKDQNEEQIIDHYVWVKGYYEQPESYNDPNTIFWGIDQDSEWIEITIKGRVQNLRLVTLKQDDDQGQLISDKLLYKLDSVEDKTVLVTTYQSEGIPNIALMFEDEAGNPYHYYIQEQSLSGDERYSNQQVFPISSN